MSVPLSPASPPRPDVSHLITEDDTPLDIYSERQQYLFGDALLSSRQQVNAGRSFVAMTNVGLFYAVKSPPVVPDGLLSLDVELPEDLFEKEHRSYFMWEYGKAPELVLEVVSNNEGDELGGKKLAYSRIGVLCRLGSRGVPGTGPAAHLRAAPQKVRAP